MNVGGFTVSGGFSAMGYSNSYNVGSASVLTGLETNLSFAAGYSSKEFTLMLGTNYFGSGKSSQQTGIVTIGRGDFTFRYENDGAPFDKMGLAGQRSDGGTLSDSYRTAALSLSYKDFEIETRLFTGRRDMSFFEGPQMEGQAYWKKGYVPNPEINDYRAGILSFGYKGYRVGINNDKVRHVVQNKFAHGLLKPQAFIPQMKLNSPYFEFKPRSFFTHW